MLKAISRRIPQIPSSRHCLIALAACAFIIARIAYFSFPDIRQVDIDYPGRDDLSPHKAISLPLLQGPENNIERFRATVKLGWLPHESTTFAIYPDDCVERVAINGVTAFDQTGAGTMKGCFPNRLTLEAETFLAEGENEMTISIVNLRGFYAFNIVSPFAPWQVVLLSACGWLAIYLSFHAVSGCLPNKRLAIPVDLQRASARTFLALFGAILTCVKLLDLSAWNSIDTRPMVLWGACIVPLCLLARALDRQRASPMPFRQSVSWTVLAAILCCIVAMTNPSEAHQDAMLYWLKCLAASVAGMFAVTPVFHFVRNVCKEPLVVAVAAVAMAASLIPFAWKLTFWEQMALPTANLVSLLLGMVGISTTTRLGTKTTDDGRIIDYHGYVTSNDFSVQIGSWCGGYEGIAMFLFLLTFFLLLDWRRFARIRNLWALLPATILYVLLVNVIRITALFVYAEIIISEVGYGEATRATVDAFHSNAGLVLYTVAFWPFMACVYQWEWRHARRAEQLHQRKENAQ